MWYTITALALGNTEPQVLASFSLLAHGSLRRLLFQPNSGLVVLGAIACGKPAGLLVASYDPVARRADLISLYVATPYRRHGIASALLKSLEWRCAHEGMRSLRFQYARNENDEAPIDAFMKSQGWPNLEPEWLIARGHVHPRLLEDRRVKLGARFYKDVQPFPWAELTKDERKKIIAHAGEANWQSTEMTPFVYEDRIEPMVSMGLRHEGEVVGWLVCHRMSSDVIRYTNLFIREDMAPRGHSMRLLIRAFCLQAESGISIATLQMRPDNEGMIKIVDRLIRPYLTDYYSFEQATKQLARH